MLTLREKQLLIEKGYVWVVYEDEDFRIQLLDEEYEMGEVYAIIHFRTGLYMKSWNELEYEDIMAELLREDVRQKIGVDKWKESSGD